MPPPTDPAAWSARFCAQLLTEPVASDPVEVVGHLLAVQAQDSRAMRLTIRRRTTLTAARQAFTQVDPAQFAPGQLTHQRTIDDPLRWPAPRLLGGFDPILHG